LVVEIECVVVVVCSVGCLRWLLLFAEFDLVVMLVVVVVVVLWVMTVVFRG
jgi:hypothetical protein